MSIISLCKHSEVLSKDEEQRLLTEAQKGSEYARHRLVTSHIRFLLNMCYRYKPKDFDAEDLLGDAVIGFLQAIDKCDPTHSARLSTYAFYRVRSAILKSQFFKRTITLPSNLRSRCLKVQRAEVFLFVDKGVVTVKNIAKVTGFSEAEVNRLRRCEDFLSDLLSLDRPVDDCDVSYVNLVADARSECEYERVNIEIDLEYFLSKLTDRERLIVERRFGIPYEVSNNQLAKQMRLSVQNASRIFNQAMKKMQRLAAALQGDPDEVQKAINFPQIVMQGV